LHLQPAVGDTATSTVEFVRRGWAAAPAEEQSLYVLMGYISKGWTITMHGRVCSTSWRLTLCSHSRARQVRRARDVARR